MRLPQPSCYQKLPHSLRKTPGVGTPPKICLLFLSVYALLPCLPRAASRRERTPREACLLGLPRPAPILSGTSRRPFGVPRDSTEAASVAVPSIRRWSLVVFPWEFRSISFPFLSLPDSFLSNDGGIHPPFSRKPPCPCFHHSAPCANLKSRRFDPAGRTLPSSLVTDHGS